MDRQDIERLTAVHAKAKVMREVHEQELRDAYLFTIPSRECFIHQPNTLIDRHRLYDTTATNSVIDLVTLTMRLLVPQNDRWAAIEVRDTAKSIKFAGRPLPFDIVAGIDAFNKQLFEYISQSNAYLTFDEALVDCIICGTGCIAIYAGEDRHCPIEYRAIHPDTLYFTENAHGVPDIVFREHLMSVRQMTQRFGTEVLPRELKDSTQSDDSDAKHKVLEIEEPLDDGRFRYSVVLMEMDWHELQVMESIFRTFIVFRFAKSSKESWGESPVRLALPSIRSLNRLVQLVESSGEYAAFGLWQSTDNTSDLSKLSGKLTAGSVINLEAKLEPIEFGGEFQIAQSMLADLRGQVKTLLFDTPLPSTEKNNYLTATEINVRMSDFYRRIGQPALRLEREFLEPILRWTVLRLIHFGFLPKPTPETLNLLGVPPNSKVTDVFTISVTSAIKKVLEINEAQQDVEAFAQVARILGPSIALKHVDADKLARKLLLDFGISPDCMRSEQAVAALEQQNKQLQSAQMAISGAQQLVDLQSKIKGNQTQGLQPGATASGPPDLAAA